MARLNLHFADLDRGLDIRVVGDVSPNRLRVRPKSGLEGLYRIEIDMAHGDLRADDFIQSLDDLSQLLKAHLPETLADTFNRQRANLADLDP